MNIIRQVGERPRSIRPARRNGRDRFAHHRQRKLRLLSTLVYGVHRYAVRGRPTEARDDEPSSARAERHGTTKIHSGAKPLDG